MAAETGAGSGPASQLISAEIWDGSLEELPPIPGSLHHLYANLRTNYRQTRRTNI